MSEYSQGYDIFEELNEDPVKQIKKERIKNYHRSIKKAKRTSKKKNDYMDKDELYADIIMYICAARRIRHSSIKKKNIDEMIDMLNIMQEKEDILKLKYTEVISHCINQCNFRNYNDAIRNDLMSYAVVNGLDKGRRKSNKRYGTPYIFRFNPDKSNNVFSFWTQMIGNFFKQVLKDHYSQIEISKEVLNDMMTVYEIKYGKYVRDKNSFLYDGKDID